MPYPSAQAKVHNFSGHERAPDKRMAVPRGDRVEEGVQQEEDALQTSKHVSHIQRRALSQT